MCQSVPVRREKTGKTPRPPHTYSAQHKSAMSGGGRMSAAIAQDQVDMMEWRSTGGARRSRARAMQDTASCDGCRAKPVSPCASVADIGGAVVPLFTLSSRLPSGGSRPATSSSSRVKPDVNAAWSVTGGTFGMALPGTEAGGYRRRPRAHHRPRQSRAARALRRRSAGGEGGECCGFSAVGNSTGRPATTAARSCGTPRRRCPFSAPSSASRQA